MADITYVTYLFDPLCGWCYGASAMLQKLVARPDIAIHLAPTGLFASDNGRPMDESFAAYAWANDQRISRLSGQPFSENYRLKVLGDRSGSINSAPATLALTAVSLIAPDREFEALKAIQKARYVEGRDVTDNSVLSLILRALEQPEAADRLTAPDSELIAANRKRIADALVEMCRFGAEGVPNLIVGVGSNRRLVRGGVLFERMEGLVEELKAA